MNSAEKNARIVWRTKSVDVTRVMPRRCADSVATVDLPVPVAPPTSRITGRSSSRSAANCRSRRIVPAPSASPSTATASSSSRASSSVDSPRSLRSLSIRRASSYARTAGTPTATSARAINPFEYGWSSVPSGRGSTCRGWVTFRLPPRADGRGPGRGHARRRR